MAWPSIEICFSSSTASGYRCIARVHHGSPQSYRVSGLKLSFIFTRPSLPFQGRRSFFLIEKWNGRRHWGLKEVQGIFFQNIGIWLNNPVCLEGTKCFKGLVPLLDPFIVNLSAKFLEEPNSQKAKKEAERGGLSKSADTMAFWEKNAVVPQCLVYFQSVLSFPNSFYAIYLGNILVTFRFKKIRISSLFIRPFHFKELPFLCQIYVGNFWTQLLAELIAAATPLSGHLAYLSCSSIFLT